MPESASWVQRPERWAIPFSPDMTDADVQRLRERSPFKEMDPENFSRRVPLPGILKNDTRIRRYAHGDIIVRKGDWGNSAFYVLSGNVRVVIDSERGEFDDEVLGRQSTQRKNIFQILAQLWKSPYPERRNPADYNADPRLGRHGSGQNTRIFLQDVDAVLDSSRTVLIQEHRFFGELAALGRSPRTATVFSEGDTALLEIRWQGLRDLMRKDEALRTHIDQQFRKNALQAFLEDTPLFAHLSTEQVAELVAASQFETHGDYDKATLKTLVTKGNESSLRDEPIIAAEGDHPLGVFLIRSGLARLSRRHHHGHKTVGYLTPGHVYGFDEIAQSWRTGETTGLKHSLRAIGNTSVVIIPTVAISKFFKSQVVSAGRSEATIESKTADASGLSNDVLEFLVEKTLINGTATMLIDLDRCTRCDDCVRACASTHDNNPRFLRSGPVHDGFMAAHACMHCQDPVCMIECPTGAIHRTELEGAVVINDRTCIGCSACANNCPYEAIRMVSVRESNGKYIRDRDTLQPITKATKCDLCVDQMGGPSCQRACPHDALVRIDLRDVDKLTKWRNR